MILLSSYGFCSPFISEKIREYFNPVGKTVLILPFAGSNCQQTAVRERERGLIPFGFSHENIYVAERNFPKDKPFDMIYVPGGDPFLLMNEAKERNLISFVKHAVENGTVYFGVSAGADFAGENLEYLCLVEDCNYCLRDYDGLGLIPQKVLCHIDQRDMGTLQRVREFDHRKTIFLRNDEVYVIP